MQNYQYIRDFERLGMGMFVHFGLYSVLGRGEWALHSCPDVTPENYEPLTERFFVAEDWAVELVRTAKEAGCRYITLTTRHHDGFSLYDTRGLSDYDAPHSAAGRDLVAEFVAACRAEGIRPFFYHTLLDWRHPAYRTDFPRYIDYLVASVELLCTRYGEIGGFWFDGFWDRRTADWQWNRLYGTIRAHQPTAMIINNTGVSDLGSVGHFEVDSVTFERGKPRAVDAGDGKQRAGEMCQVLNDHWGYAAGDCNYKSVGELLNNLLDCRACGCNFLLNTGPMGDGHIHPMDKAILGQVGKFVRAMGDFIYDARASLDVHIVEGDGTVLAGENCYYVVARNIGMCADPNVALTTRSRKIKLNRPIRRAVALDNGEEVPVEGDTVTVIPYPYGKSLFAKVIKVEL